MILAFATAGAHPLGTQVSTETLVLRLEPEHVVVNYSAEVDTALLAARSSGRDPVDDLAVELETGLQLRIDGAAVPLGTGTRRTDPARTEHTVAVDETWRVALPPEASSVSLTTTNLVDTRVMRAADVWVHPSLRVSRTSVLGERDGKVVRDDGLRWHGDESAREVSVTFRREPRAWTWLAGRGTEPVRAPAALDPRGLARWGPATTEPAAALWWLLCASTCRGAADAPATHRLAGIVVGVAAAVAMPRTGLAELGGAALLLVGCATPWRAWFLPLALAGLLSTVHPLRATLLGAVLLAIPLPRPAEPRPAASLLAAAAFLTLRGAAATWG